MDGICIFSYKTQVNIRNHCHCDLDFTFKKLLPKTSLQRRILVKFKKVMLLIVFGTSWAFAADNSKRVDFFAIKSNIENLITQRYRDRIATQLPPELFSVAVQVNLEVKKPETEKNNTDGVEDVSLGIIQSVDTPVEALPKEVKNSIVVKKVEVLIGISSKLGNDYKEKLNAWAAVQVKNEYGNAGSFKIVDLAPLPKEESQKENPQQQRILTFDEKFGHYQNVLGFVVFGALVLLATVLLKLIPSRDTKEQLQMSLKIQEMRAAQLQLTQPNRSNALERKESEKEKSQDQHLNANILFDNLKDHQKKVVLIALSQVSALDSAFEQWVEQGLDGRQKIAILIDSLMAYYGDPSMQKHGAYQLNWVFPENLKNDRQIAEAFSTLGEMSLANKTALIEKAYWDMLTLKTLGVSQGKRPFAGIIDLPSNKIQKLLTGQDKKVLSLAILHLPQEKMEQVIVDFTLEDKEQLVLNAFENPIIKRQELEMLDQSLKFLVKNNAAQEDSAIEIPAMLPNFLMSLNPREEILLLRQIHTKLKDQGLYIKQNYPTVAFLNEWPDDKIKAFIQSLGNSDLRAIIKAVPEVKDKMLGLLTGRSQAILRDSLKRELSDDDFMKSLENIRLKLFRMVNSGVIKTESIFKVKMESGEIKRDIVKKSA